MLFINSITNQRTMFGWASMQSAINSVSNPVLNAIKSFSTSVQTRRFEIVSCIDMSGSTTYKNGNSHDGKNFSEIYSEALRHFYAIVPQTNVIAWSSEAIELTGEKLTIFSNCVENLIPVAEQIINMNSGTSPEKILPLINNRLSIIITDGDIGNSSLMNVKNNLMKLECGPIFLIIIPHIHQYSNLYSSQNVENDAKNNINISIPQAFSEKLAGVYVWSYGSKTYDAIPELTAKWAQNIRLNDIANSVFPIHDKNKILVQNKNGDYSTFDINGFINYANANINLMDIDCVNYISNLNIASTIKQNATASQKNLWNDIVKKIYVNLFNAKYDQFCQNGSSDLVDNSIMTDKEKFDIFIRQKKEKINIEKEFNKDIGKLIQDLYVDKTVGEMTTIGSAKAVQTQLNVQQFQSMSVDSKLASLVPILVQDTCTICAEDGRMFSVISIRQDLIDDFHTTTREITVGKKNQVKKIIDFLKFKSLLESNKPHLHYSKLCADCSQHAMSMLKHHSDPEYGITKYVPQNYEGSKVVNRLIIVPLISPEFINPECNPNTDLLSFARQWFRGIISKLLGLEPASQECLNACLLFLTSIANQENANIILANQTSLVRGGRVDKYPDTIGRLFKPTFGQINMDTVNIISAVYEVVEKAGIQVLPQSTKLLLLCLIENKVNILLNASNLRDKTAAKLKYLIEYLIANKKIGIYEKDVDSFELNVNEIYQCKSFQNFMLDANKFNGYCGIYLAKHLNIHSLVITENYMNKLLQSTTIEQVAESLGLNLSHLKNLIRHSGSTDEQFVSMIVPFISQLQNDSNHTQVIMNFI